MGQITIDIGGIVFSMGSLNHENQQYLLQRVERKQGWQYVLLSENDPMVHTFRFPDKNKPPMDRWKEMIARPDIEQIEFVRREVSGLFDSLAPKHDDVYRRKASIDVTPKMIEASKLVDPIKDYLHTAYSVEYAEKYPNFNDTYFELTCNVTTPRDRHVDGDMKLRLRSQNFDLIPGPSVGYFFHANFGGYPRKKPDGKLQSYAELPLNTYGWKAKQLELVQAPATEAQFILEGYRTHYPNLFIPSQLVEFAREVFTENQELVRWNNQERPMY